MKLEHISKIKGKVALSSNLKSANVLDGSYRSIFKGKSMDFEELREYNMGDNVKDIDWRASARSLKVLIREHIAEKKHNVVFVLDSKVDMNANANPDEIKRDICIDVAGTIAYLAYRNGDYTGAIYMNDNIPKFFSLKQQLFHIENYLTYYEEDLKNQKIRKRKKNRNSLNESLRYLTNYLSKRSIIVIVSDLAGFDEIDDNLLKAISYRNDVLAVQINDISMNNAKSYDLNNRKYFAPMFAKNRRLSKLDKEIKEKVFTENADKLKKYRVPIVAISNDDDVVDKVIELFNMHNEMIYK